MHVPKLPVNVPTDGHWGRDLVDVGFFEEDVADAGAEGFHLAFGEVFALEEL